MALIKVLIIFVVILALLNKRLPLYLAMIFGSLLMIVMFRLPLATAGQTALHTLTGWDVWSVNLAMYVISVLVYELGLRHRFEDAQRAMNGLMRDPRLNTSLACCIGKRSAKRHSTMPSETSVTTRLTKSRSSATA